MRGLVEGDNEGKRGEEVEVSEDQCSSGVEDTSHGGV